MTNKEFVLSIYPDATIDSEYIAGYSVYKFEKDGPVSVVAGNIEVEVWEKMRRYIEHKMLRKFES